MSLILDALSRAEREKREQANPTPSILSQDLASPGPEKTTRGIVLPVSVVITILVFMAALWIYFLREDAPVPLASGNADSLPEHRGEQAQRQPIALEAPAASEVQGTPLEQRQAPSQSNAAVAKELGLALNTDRQQSADAVAALYAMSSKEMAEEASEAIDSVAKEAESTADEISAQQSVAEELIDIERVLREMRAKASPGTLVPHPAPLLEDLTKQFRDRVPTLMYSSHDFNSAGRSSVVINGETLTLTQRSRGVEVREILADSVILRFEGTDFRLKSLNSWVNL